MTIDQVLSEFADAWNAGRRPQVDDYLERVPEADRDALADGLLAWLAIAPAPAYDEPAVRAIRAEPALVALREAQARPAGLLATLVPQLRARRGLSLEEVAGRVADAVGHAGERARTAAYLERLERGELPAAGLSRRLLEALADALRASAGALADAAAVASPARPALGMQFRKDAGGEWFAEHLDALSAAAVTRAPEAPLDELDRLFLGGPDA